MAENPNLNMALEAVLRDRDDLYRRLMQAERKLKEMSAGYERLLRSQAVRER